MSTTILRRTWKLVLLLLVQILLLNNIHLLGYATPVVIAALTLGFQRGSSRIGLLAWGFAIGLLFDMFSNTMGIGMSSATLLAMLQPVLLNLFIPRDAADDLVPSSRTMGASRYSLYVLVSMLVFHTVFYALDAFTLVAWPLTLLAIGGGTVMATLVVLFLQTLHFTKNE